MALDPYQYSEETLRAALRGYVAIPKAIKDIAAEKRCSMLRAWRYYYGGDLGTVTRRLDINRKRFMDIEKRLEEPYPEEVKRITAYYRAHKNCLFLKLSDEFIWD